METLRDVISRLDQIDEGDRFEIGPAIFARRPWTPESEAVVLREDTFQSHQHPGFDMVLEASIAREVLDAWSQWREGREPTVDEAVEAIIHYGTHDAYQPVE